MKKITFILILPLILAVITGCEARRNTIHFEPDSQGQVSEAEADNTTISQKKEEGKGAKEVKSKTPVTLKVTSVKGGELETNENYHVIRGTTPENTHTIKINNYRLTKYLPGQTAWSYIAATNLNTLKEGQNKYTITALDNKGKMIAKTDFSIKYTPSARTRILPAVGVNTWTLLNLSLILSGILLGIRTARKAYKRIK